MYFSNAAYILSVCCLIGGCSLTFPPHIFSVQVKSGVCYITGQWGRVQIQIE